MRKGQSIEQVDCIGTQGYNSIKKRNTLSIVTIFIWAFNYQIEEHSYKSVPHFL